MQQACQFNINFPNRSLYHTEHFQIRKLWQSISDLFILTGNLFYLKKNNTETWAMNNEMKLCMAIVIIWPEEDMKIKCQVKVVKS